MYRSTLAHFIPMASLLVISGLASADATGSGDSKIRFDLDRLNADGLQGPLDGLRALHYEYCIPDRPEATQAVAAIDPTLEIQRDSPGGLGAVRGNCFV